MFLNCSMLQPETSMTCEKFYRGIIALPARFPTRVAIQNRRDLVLDHQRKDGCEVIPWISLAFDERGIELLGRCRTPTPITNRLRRQSFRGIQREPADVVIDKTLGLPPRKRRASHHEQGTPRAELRHAVEQSLQDVSLRRRFLNCRQSGIQNRARSLRRVRSAAT